MFDSQTFCAVASTPSSQPRSDLVRQIKAQTAAEAALETLRGEARRQAEAAYAQGPGRKRVRGWESLPETNAIYRREKKTRSAYVSRFKAKEYERLLEHRLHVVAVGNETAREQLAKENEEQESLIRQIRDLKRQLSVATSSPTISETTTTYSSPVSTATAASVKAATVACQPFSFEPFPLLGVPKISPGLFEDCFSGDEQEEQDAGLPVTSQFVTPPYIFGH